MLQPFVSLCVAVRDVCSCRRPGEAQGPKPDLVYIDPATGLQKNVKPSGAVLTERVRLGVHVNKRMRVSAGRHQGLQCTILSIDDQV